MNERRFGTFSQRERSRASSRGLSAVIPVVLTLLIVTAIAAAAFNLRTLFYDFDVREIIILQSDKSDTPGHRFDRALFEHLAALSYITSFDHVLQRGPVSTPVNALRVDRCEVRQGDFYKFMQWRKHNLVPAIAAPSQPRNWVHLSNNRGHTISGRLEAPANGVAYYDAYAYCRAGGGRLPFGEEWAAIAAGQDGRLYPWGNEFNELDWLYLDPLLNAAQRCALNPETDTPDGVHNMGGAVSEWAQNAKAPLRPTIHGGNAYNQPREIYSLSPLYRYAPPEYRSPYVGFRCVYDHNKPLAKTPWGTAVNAAAIKPGHYETGVPRDARLPTLLTNLPRDSIYLLERLFQNKREEGDKTLFFMEREVTRAQYKDFLLDPLVRLGLYADDNEPKEHDYRPANWQEQMKRPDLPVVSVDWWSAYAFATWAGGRLPSAYEWVAAASSQGRHVYPWGNQFVAGKALTGEALLTSAQPGGTSAGDVTADGLLDMGGNVSELTQSTDVADGGYIIVVKGGNYLLPGKETTRIDFKNTVPPNYRSPAVGLRVVFDRKPATWKLPQETAEETSPAHPSSAPAPTKSDNDRMTDAK